MDSRRTALAWRILEMISHGHTIPFDDAIQLRNWAITPEDAMLPLEEIARAILGETKNPNAKAAEQ
jgi:hypothetical protein